MAEEEEQQRDIKPLSPDEFRNALHAVSSLGLTWTADRIPRLKAKSPETESAFLSDEYLRLESEYPNLPRELSAIVYHALTGSVPYGSIVGSPEELREKVAVVRDLLLTTNYRSEFFFKYAIKVPYFEDLDWEVVFKTHEKNVEEIPAVGYALLLLTFHNTNASISSLNAHENVTVAVDLPLINKLISTLVNVKTALEDVNMISQRLAGKESPTEESNARDN